MTRLSEVCPTAPGPLELPALGAADVFPNSNHYGADVLGTPPIGLIHPRLSICM